MVCMAESCSRSYGLQWQASKHWYQKFSPQHATYSLRIWVFVMFVATQYLQSGTNVYPCFVIFWCTQVNVWWFGWASLNIFPHTMVHYHIHLDRRWNGYPLIIQIHVHRTLHLKWWNRMYRPFELAYRATYRFRPMLSYVILALHGILPSKYVHGIRRQTAYTCILFALTTDNFLLYVIY